MTLLEIAQVAKELAELVQQEDIDEQTRDAGQSITNTMKTKKGGKD